MPDILIDSIEYDALFKQAGYNGCIGSSNVIHVGMLSCASWESITHIGHKLNIPSRTYNATVSRCRQILETTCGHPAIWNDKTIILYGKFIRRVRDGELFDDYEFKLLEHNDVGNIVEILYSGI